MSKTLENFNNFFEHFRQDPLWIAMVSTRENSPWHREANVGEHSKMLLDWYRRNLFDYRSETQRALTLVACLMHDIGKPPAEIIKESPERGVYRAYHGHELISARLWMDYALRNRSLLNYLFHFTLTDLANISLMLEHHVPWATKNINKRRALKQTFLSRMGEDGHRAWLDLLLSDQHGRIADEQPRHLAEVEVWMKEWEQLQ